MVSVTTSTSIAWIIAGLFAISALLHLSGSAFAYRAYGYWGFPRESHRVVGVGELVVAVFLAESITRIWGVVLAAIIIVIVVVTLLKNRHYAWTIPAVCVLIALVPASLSAIH
jgi:hypothetical protein